MNTDLFLQSKTAVGYYQYTFLGKQFHWGLQTEMPLFEAAFFCPLENDIN
jgi:hypothetical protein